MPRAGGRTGVAGVLRTGAAPERRGRGRLLHSGLPAGTAPDLERGERPDSGSGTAGNRQHARRGEFDRLRTMRAPQGRQNDPYPLPHLGDHSRSRAVPFRAGNRLHGHCHARRMRRTLPEGEHALHRMLRPPGRRQGPGSKDDLGSGLDSRRRTNQGPDGRRDSGTRRRGHRANRPILRARSTNTASAGSLLGGKVR